MTYFLFFYFTHLFNKVNYYIIFIEKNKKKDLKIQTKTLLTLKDGGITHLYPLFFLPFHLFCHLY